MIALLCAVFVTLGATASVADNLEADGDGVDPVTSNALAFGTVCVGSSKAGNVALAVKRNGSYPSTNVYEKGTSVAVTRTGISGAGLSSPVSVGTITIPSNWDTVPNNTLTSSVLATVTWEPTSTGPLSGSVTFSASGEGSNAGSQTLTRAASVPVTGTATVCDSTPPVITPSISGTIGNNGWYTSNVTVGWAVADGESTISSSSGCTTSVLATDSGGTTYTCTAASAGGSASGTVTIKRDATPPTGLSVAADRSPDSGPWYTAPFTATWSATDPMSGIDTCTVTSYSGPDTAAGSLSGGCTDKAGNSTTQSAFAFSYDGTGPVVTGTADRAPDHNGWYNAPVTITWTAGSDVSGVTCEGPTVYDGPSSATVILSATCTDGAGHTGTGTFGAFKYDDDAPTATASPDRDPDRNGWYNHAVTISFSGQDEDGGSGIDSCTAATTYSGASTDAGSASGTCTDVAGNTSSVATHSFKYDGTAPTASVALDRDPDSNGWYSGAVTASWTGEDDAGGSGIDACDPDLVYEGPDDANASVSGTCMDIAGNESLPAGVTFAYDGTGPEIVFAGSDPAANGAGWHKSSVTLTWACTDATSGVLAGETTAVLDAEGTNLDATGTCEDLAGHTASDTQGGFNIDKTKPAPPTATASPAANGDGWNNVSPVTVSFTDNGDTGGSGVGSCTAPIDVTGETSGQLVSGTCIDVAGNESDASTVTVRIDLTDPNAPTLSADRAPDFGDWYKDTVTVSSTDNGDDGVVQSGVRPASVDAPVTFTTSGSHTVTDTVMDKADNESVIASLTVKVDATDPQVTATCPSAPLLLGQTASASWTASDAHSGLATASSGTVLLDTASVGSKSVTIPAGTARDNVGHGSAAASCSYSVAYKYTGYLQPVNDTAHQTGVNQSKFKLGSTVPLKFKIFDANDVPQQQATAPWFSRTYRGATCDSTTTLESETAPSSTAGTEYKFDTTARQYHYNFSTKGLAAGEYRVWINGLADGNRYYTDICVAR